MGDWHCHSWNEEENWSFFVLIVDGSAPLFYGEIIESDKLTEFGSGWKAHAGRESHTCGFRNYIQQPQTTEHSLMC